MRKLLPGGKREPKVLAVFSNRQQDCDRLIRYLSRRVGDSSAAAYPIHVYCLEKPYESQRCARVVVDPDPGRLYRQARSELAEVWVALSATSWNGVSQGTRLKLIPFTFPPFRGIVGNENGDFFPLSLVSIARHLTHRIRQWRHHHFFFVRDWMVLHVVWPARHVRSWLRKKLQDKVVWGTAVGLSKVAWFAERAVPVTRIAFDRLPEGQPSPLEPPEPAGDPGITRIEFQDLEWRRSDILRSIQSSQSRYVLFCPPGYVESFDDLLPPFAALSTFAVTRQNGFREWRPMMVALSPFRPLAPREASSVAAPLSDVVLVDRQKLLKLEIPDTLVFGAAWLSLFWRAGAAGWRSYCIGMESKVPQQTDYWLEEMLFVKHLYQDPELQRLACEAPLLSRGNVAWRPDLVQPYRGLPRVLVVAPYLPFPLSHGGAVRIYNLCRSLCDSVDFILICFREVTDKVDYEELHRIFRQVYIVDLDEITSNPDLPKQVNNYETASMRALIGAVAKEQQVDILQIEYTDLAAYRETVPDKPAILVEHDITYTLYRQFADREQNPALIEEYQRWHKFETERLRTFDSVFVMSPQDQDEAVRAGASRQRTFVIPNGVDLHRFRALPPPDGDPEVFYVGSFRHLPNYLAFEELRCRIMPLVWERFPHAVLRVVAGPDHEQHWRNALKGAPIPHLDPRIVIHGFVSDLLPLYQTAHIVAVPLPLSAGTNIKVMEALSCQRAVVASPVGAQGLGLKDHHDALISNLGPEFAGAICSLLDNSPLRDKIAEQGRATAEARFGWDAIGRDAMDAYSLLIRESGAQRTAGNGRYREKYEQEHQSENNNRRESRGILESA
ncbi:MAG TPA: glycosyltransferase family 4 protein [Bryobacteraceae bacterium]